MERNYNIENVNGKNEKFIEDEFQAEEKLMFNKKRILLLCKESYSYPMYYLAEKWKKNNEIAAYFFMPQECLLNKSELNDTTYYAFEEAGYKIYDVKAITEKFIKEQNTYKIDNKYLEYIEHLYGTRVPFNMQILSTQYFTKYYHWRWYYEECTYEQQILWLLLNYENAIRIFEEYKPDIIIDCDNAEVGRTVVNEIAYTKGIPHITIDCARYNKWFVPNYNLMRFGNDYFKKIYDENLKKDEVVLSESIKKVNDFRSSSTIMSSLYANTVTSQYTPDPLFKSFKTILGYIRYFFHTDIMKGNLKLKRQSYLLFTNSRVFISNMVFKEYWRRKLLKKNKYFEPPVEGEKYVYMPLHLIPESSTFVSAPLYINELFMIETVSKCLPMGWFLYVKEHQAMVGERGIDFYKKIKKLPNVRLVQLNYYQDPKPWILKAQAVITITGTTAFEAAMLGKKAIILGRTSYECIEGIHRLTKLDDLNDLFKNPEIKDNVKSCAAYIETLKECGEELDLLYILDKGFEQLRYNKTPDKYFYDQIDAFERLYEKGYELYKRGEK